ncbi:B3-hordein-like [Spinacia oleracea]|uniref:B3-hordein-like n=1 Tax=Spinacia oleracea TaxID=3562 RepID=A0ABM3QY68_SPIOL|nr:B3-hordein-like [Spinacia oleracea]
MEAGATISKTPHQVQHPPPQQPYQPPQQQSYQPRNNYNQQSSGPPRFPRQHTSPPPPQPQPTQSDPMLVEMRNMMLQMQKSLSEKDPKIDALTTHNKIIDTHGLVSEEVQEIVMDGKEDEKVFSENEATTESPMIEEEQCYRIDVVDFIMLDALELALDGGGSEPESTKLKRPVVPTSYCVEKAQKGHRALISAPIIRSPEWDLPFEIMCDTSDYAVGAVLGQRKEKVLAPK